MFARPTDMMLMRGAVAPAASRGSAARLARRLVRLLRQGRGLAVHATGSNCPAESCETGAEPIAAPAMPAVPQGRTGARAPRPASRPGAARRISATPGRPGARPAAAIRPVSPVPSCAHARRAVPCSLLTQFRRAVPGVTRF